jgi:hypothetical protein
MNLFSANQLVILQAHVIPNLTLMTPFVQYHVKNFGWIFSQHVNEMSGNRCADATDDIFTSKQISGDIFTSKQISEKFGWFESQKNSC